MGHQQEKQGDKVYGYQGPAYREKADRVIVLEHTASMPIHSWTWAVSQSVGVGNDFSKHQEMENMWDGEKAQILEMRDKRVFFCG